MTILVTGAGAIGLKTALMLQERGERVALADVRPIDLDGVEAGEGLTTAICDVLDRPSLDRLIESHGVTAIVHTAALLSTAIRKDPPRGVLVNTVGTANVLEAARAFGLRRVVVASSTTVGYSAFASHDASPIEEDFSLRVVSERPGSVYAATKLAAEHLALLYGDLYGLEVVILRYGAVLSGGAGLATSVPGRLLDLLLTAGASGRPAVIDEPLLVWAGKEEFIDARDCAVANLHALDAGDPTSRVYNVATGEWHSFEDVCAAVRRVHPTLEVDLRVTPKGGFAGFPHLRPAPSDTGAAQRELGFRARIGLAETIRDLSRR